MGQNVHMSYDLKQMQSLPLDSKIFMTQMRIRAWYDSWVKYEIYNKETGKTRFVTATDTPPLRENEYIESEEAGQVYVSFSGGKDSTVLKHIVDSMYNDVPALFVNTGLEFPEIQAFAKEIKAGKYDCFNSDVEIVRPEMRFDEVLKTYGYPVITKEVAKTISEANRGVKHALCAFEGKTVDGTPSRYRQRFVKYGYLVNSEVPVSHKCCDVMKKKPAKSFEKKTGRIPITGTMACESALRKNAWLKTGCNAFNANRPISQPMSFWTEQDVLAYIVKYNIPYCPVYGEIIGTHQNGAKFTIDELRTLYNYNENDILSRITLSTTGYSRTGCTFCAFGCHLEKEPNRFQMLKETHPRQYKYCIDGGEMVDGKWQPNKDGLGMGKVLDYIGVKYD